MKKYKTVLSIAGSDSGGGAGIQADIKTISACGCYAMTAITSLTAQNTLGVSDVHVVPCENVERQIRAVLDDIGADAVKLGMLPTAEIIRCVSDLLRRYRVRNVVLDPVMVSTSGYQLINDEAADALRTHLLPLATLVTPNILETSYLSGLSVTSEADFAQAAMHLRLMGARAVLIKAGHLTQSELTDHLYSDFVESDRPTHTYTFPRLDTPNTHGTGCTLSSAIASFLAQGHLLPDAVEMAENYLHQAIASGQAYIIGAGHGPVHHFFASWKED